MVEVRFEAWMTDSRPCHFTLCKHSCQPMKDWFHVLFSEHILNSMQPLRKEKEKTIF